MKIAVVQFYDENIKKYASINHTINKIYCQKYDLDIIVSNERKYSERPPHWEKLILLLDVINNSDCYDYLVWIDADAFFYDNAKDIREIINEYPSKDFIFSKDISNSNPNTGIFIVKNTHYSIDFLKKWAYDENIYKLINPKRNWHEQEGLIYTFIFDILNINERSIQLDYGILQHFNENDRLNDTYILHKPNTDNNIRYEISQKYLNMLRVKYKNEGLELINKNNSVVSDIAEGIHYLERALCDYEKDTYSNEEIELIARIGYYYAVTHNYEKAFYWLIKIIDKDKKWGFYLGLLTPLMPKTIEEEKNTLFQLDKRMDFLMTQSITNINLMIFSHPFYYAYYNNNPKCILEKYTQLMMKTFPEISNQNYMLPKSIQPKNTKKIKLGIFTRSLIPEIELTDSKIHCSSISDSFYPTLKQLSPDKFDITYIYFGYEKNPHDTKNLYIPTIPPHYTYIKKIQQEIVNLNLDILLFLEFHMESLINFIPLSKLAPIQVCTHGHPVTTGLPRHLMDYFISWEAAEIPEAQNHYTEELVMIPANNVWEYYIPRNTNNFISLKTNQPWGHYNRSNMSFCSNIDPNLNWYFCSQGTFKFHISFDKMIASILKKDKNAMIILISINKELYSLNERHIARLKSMNVDLDRIVFLDKLSHHELMAMHKNVDVVLDTYFFGGDTTSREAFEIGAPIVTLPSNVLGGRWTYAYYKAMGITELIAKNEDDYADIVVKVATNKEYATKLRSKIMNATDKLFKRKEAINEWENILTKIYNSK